MPANAGPTARARLKATLFNATAALTSCGATKSVIIACHAGPLMADPTPRRNVNRRSRAGLIAPAYVAALRAAAAASIHTCVIKIRARRSTISASAPARNASRNTGRLVAACTMAMIRGDGLKVVINHDAPTFCIHVPMLEAIVANHRTRNTDCRSGLHGERSLASFEGVDPEVFIQIRDRPP
jgi:hypothetical protein